MINHGKNLVLTYPIISTTGKKLENKGTLASEILFQRYLKP